jgi:flagellar hook-associated protein 1 FlgK
MSDLLNTGLSGLRAYSRSLATIGDNIANAQTPGYARRTLALRETTTNGNNALLKPFSTPGGVEIAGLARATDIWVQNETRLSHGESERSRLRFAATDAVGSVLDNSQNAIVTGLTSLFTTADQLTADASSVPLRTQFLNAVDQIATGFRQVATRLSGLADANVQSAGDAVNNINHALTSLDAVNLSLLRSREGSTQEASLLDERDRLIDQLSSQLDVTASFGNRGTVTLRSMGAGDVLLDNSGAQSLAVQATADGRISFNVGAQPLAVNTGMLAGLVDAGNHIADQRAAVDQLANDVAAQINSAHQAGLDRDGQPGRALFIGGPGAAGMTAASLTPGHVAAANATSPNGNILAFGGLRGPNGPEAIWAGHISQQSSVGANAKAQHEATTFRFETAVEARDRIQGVDLDREATDLVRFQQAYTAAAQTIQVARETLQALFNAI